ncbi:cell division ATP-binding protein FtsE [Luxibacter massiliensis]|uniref:cell division ATP-binding protein FtsE n=1 Tax=Luxibacter massiliensis TaxID=2219695 RepID=UPI000F064D37|nr:ATP-binding cassette domain-containing protein [Luxibacter massiliensis]
MAEIIFEHVTKMFRDEIALDDVSLEVEKGEFVFVIGKSGAGKSTLLNLIMKQEDVTSGHIIVEGRQLDLMRPSRIAAHRRKLGIMSPEVGLLKDRSIYDNIALAIWATGRNNARMRNTIIKVLGLVGIADKAPFFPNELSGGEQARALLARALSVNPSILIADEPTANLDPDAAWDLMQLLEEVNYKGMTVIVASHARELVTIMRKRCITLVAGTVVADEKHGIYNYKAVDIFEERRILEEREKKKAKKS